MQPRYLPLLFLVAATLPAATPAIIPPYTVVLNSPGQSPSLSIFNDVTALSGLKLDPLLSTLATSQPKMGQVTFMRNWHGEFTLSNAVGYKAPTFPPTVATVWVGDPPLSPPGTPTANYAEMSKPYFSEWALVAENGCYVLEVSRFTYGTRGVYQEAIPNSGD